MTEAPSGTLVIAVASVNLPNGLPRFCTAGCSETIYLSGITETLFNSKATPEGQVTTEPMLALDFTLDPSLGFGDFTLREGVMFHGDYGEMTANDVAFSFNDANSVTNPESIHGQATDFALLIQSMDAIDKYTARLNYRNYDSRGMLHRFSRFWQTAAIVSSKVYEQHGVEGMQDIYVGTGAFVSDEWSQNKGIFLSANPNYYGTELGLGPFVEKIKWLEVSEGWSRRAMLETGEAQIAQVATKDFPDLFDQGFVAQKGGLYSTITGISFAGNYWEAYGALSGDKLERHRGSGRRTPWIGDPFGGHLVYDENTPSMQNARLVRNAFAWAIEREELVENNLGGLGFVNHQASLSINNPNYRDEWSWGTDFAKAKSLMAEAGYPDGFVMEIWVGTGELGAEILYPIGMAWNEHLGIKIMGNKTGYESNRPGLVGRTTNLPSFFCDADNSNFPYDWPRGFGMSSLSAGGYGVGQEIPYATESYSAMAGEPNKAKREELAANFYTQNRYWANCVGIFEEPVWPIVNPNKIAEWDMRPTANENLNTINNVRTIKLK